MKIPIRNPKKLQRMIDRRVAAVERANTLFFYKSKIKDGDAVWGRLKDIYNAVRDAGRPVDYRYITYAMGLPPTPYSHWRISTRIGWLATRGYLREVGRGPVRYTQHGAKLFVAVPVEEIKIVQDRVKRAIDHLVNETARTAQLVNDVPLCVAKRIGPNPFLGKLMKSSTPERNAEIIRLRLGGMGLQEIGDKYGITRERCRQIVERAITKTAIRPSAKELILMQHDARHEYRNKKGDVVRPNRYVRAALTETANAILDKYDKPDWK